jgi:hypothetical protein
LDAEGGRQNKDNEACKSAGSAIVLATAHVIKSHMTLKPNLHHGLKIGEAVQFADHKSLAAFFQEGPGRSDAFLQAVTFIGVVYRDDRDVNNWWPRSTHYAYEAFELLQSRWHLMRVKWLQICFP